MNINNSGQFNINMKEISADKDLKSFREVFDPTSPE
jgi:hypothetical protein